MKKHKIVYILSHPIQYYVPLFRELGKNKNLDFKVLYCSKWGYKQYNDKFLNQTFSWDIDLMSGYKYDFLKNYSWHKSSRNFFSWINPEIYKRLKNEKPDVIVIPGYAAASYLMAYFSAFFLHIPIFFRGETVLRSKPFILKNIFLKYLFRRTDCFLSIGKQSDLFYDYFKIAKNKIFFSPYSIDNDRFIKDSKKFQPLKKKIKKELSIPDLPVILFVGKLIPRKKPFDLLEAFKSLESKAVLVFIGDGILLKSLKQQIKIENIKNVFFMGFINQNKLPRFYALADIFVITSNNQEVSPLVINEAMCTSLPIIASDAIPSAKNFVKNKNGFLYPCGDSMALRKIIKMLIENKTKRQKMGQNSLKIISNWTPKRAAQGIIKALKNL